jgi:alkylhydroperoxidase/carboxymuconolactone decarboxylase family protein YurZ
MGDLMSATGAAGHAEDPGPSAPGAPPAASDLLARGEKTRREVLGDEYVDRLNQNAPALMIAWRRYAMEAAWGGLWGRPGLDLKTRSLCTISALAALGSTRELRTHLRGALRLGITPAELAEIFIQVGGYAGSACAGSAFQIASGLLAEMADHPEETGR